MHVSQLSHSALPRPRELGRVAVTRTIRFIQTTLNVPACDDDGRPMFLLKCMHLAIDRLRALAGTYGFQNRSHSRPRPGAVVVAST
jgi:hypothetical protein